MADQKAHVPGKEKVVLFWESEVVKNPDGSVSLAAIMPQAHMTRKQAAKALGCSVQVITNLFRAGHLTGYKPGGWQVRKDGRASNAALRLDADSVLRYKERQQAAAKDWQAAE